MIRPAVHENAFRDHDYVSAGGQDQECDHQLLAGSCFLSPALTPTQQYAAASWLKENKGVNRDTDTAEGNLVR